MRRMLAATAALVAAGTGLVSFAAPATALPEPEATAVCGTLNPMAAATPTGSADGYTVFVRENAIFANSETEGSIAVGATATFGDPRGNLNAQYPVMHGGVGGNADYNAPTINGSPNRVLVQEFSSQGKAVQVKATGATGTNALAGAKIGNHSVPERYTFGQMFGGSGTTFYPVNGGNQSPQIDSAVQPWTDLATAQQSWGLDGDVLSHFPADSGSKLLSSFNDWQPVNAPVGNDQSVILNASGPSTLPLSAFAGIEKFNLKGYAEQSFLVITVAPSDVVDGRVTVPTYSDAGKNAPANEGISHVLFDFSDITGDVEVTTSNEPVRGAIYAPNAHIVFPSETNGGKEFEGQIIAQNFTALQGGKEMHTNLFKGRFPVTTCVEEPVAVEGTFMMRKILSGIDAETFPEGTTFPVTATWGDVSHEFELPADGTVVPAEVVLPEGTVVTFTEGALPESPEGYEFVSKAFSTASITILADDNANIEWSVTNTYDTHGVSASGADADASTDAGANGNAESSANTDAAADAQAGSNAQAASDAQAAATSTSEGNMTANATAVSGADAQIAANGTVSSGLTSAAALATTGSSTVGVVIMGALLFLTGGATLIFRRRSLLNQQ